MNTTHNFSFYFLVFTPRFVKLLKTQHLWCQTTQLFKVLKQTVFMYKPISINVGTLSKNAIKTKNCNLFNHLNFHSTEESREKTFSVFSLTNLIVFCKY